MINKDELFHEILSGDRFFCWDCDVTHNISSCSIVINRDECLAPFSKFTRLNASFRITRIAHEVIKYCSFRWEFSSSFPFSLPPVRELLTIVNIFFFGKGTSTAPNDSKGNNILDVTELFSENDFKDGAKRSNHRDRCYRN